MIARLFDFSGRATRNELGLTLLWGFIALIGPELLLVFATGMTSGQMIGTGADIALLGIALYVERIAVLVIVVAAAVRRMHDQNDPWYGILIFLIPLLGWVLLAITLMAPGDEGENRYGLPPETRDRNDRLERIFD
jgi:uncharacterized membrane protein YhaH (DUF805 family)